MRSAFVGVLFLAGMAAVVSGQTLQPARDVAAQDAPVDAGGVIEISWRPSPDETGEASPVLGYEVWRATSAAGEYKKIADATPGKESYMVSDSEAENGVEYFYKIKTRGEKMSTDTAPAGPVAASAQWFHRDRLNMLIASIILSAFVLYYISQARAGKELFIRRIAGLEAVQEAVGRATEMGKPVLFVPGISDVDDIQTIASLTILGRVATMIAEYDANLLVPCSRSLVMATAQEVVKEAYMEAGRPDAYRRENIRYLTDDQFGYVAGVDGIMLREKPAANFYLGTFYAESLILAETGHSIGAIQIAGTAMPSQLPFFIAACDYTLIGEELFAASAYLSREPRLLGSMLGQDWGKVLILFFIIVGAITAFVAQFGVEPFGYSIDLSQLFVVR
ncbi:MAG: hypothetical protein PVH29_04480 [Candidatus Zixiibacteriota bacterium]